MNLVFHECCGRMRGAAPRHDYRSPKPQTPKPKPSTPNPQSPTLNPQVVDECGTLVPNLIMQMAKSRNLQLEFGPRAGQFSMRVCAAKNKDGAIRNVVDKHGMPDAQLYAVGEVSCIACSGPKT